MKIYVVVYKEVTQTMSMSSSHTKVRRIIASTGCVLTWSHTARS